MAISEKFIVQFPEMFRDLSIAGYGKDLVNKILQVCIANLEDRENIPTPLRSIFYDSIAVPAQNAANPGPTGTSDQSLIFALLISKNKVLRDLAIDLMPMEMAKANIRFIAGIIKEHKNADLIASIAIYFAGNADKILPGNAAGNFFSDDERFFVEELFRACGNLGARGIEIIAAFTERIQLHAGNSVDNDGNNNGAAYIDSFRKLLNDGCLLSIASALCGEELSGEEREKFILARENFIASWNRELSDVRLINGEVRKVSLTLPTIPDPVVLSQIDKNIDDISACSNLDLPFLLEAFNDAWLESEDRLTRTYALMAMKRLKKPPLRLLYPFMDCPDAEIVRHVGLEISRDWSIFSADLLDGNDSISRPAWAALNKIAAGNLHEGEISECLQGKFITTIVTMREERNIARLLSFLSKIPEKEKKEAFENLSSFFTKNDASLKAFLSILEEFHATTKAKTLVPEWNRAVKKYLGANSPLAVRDKKLFEAGGTLGNLFDKLRKSPGRPSEWAAGQ
ncbi:MAG: hypothetical protein LBF24_00740 [Puniceicoccales bacterium]|nr:hypothetical protein [Puniceicoccales bacterium]